MNCDDVRELLPEHLLGTLDGPEDLEVGRHLRGCGPCRSEMLALGEGVNTFARAAHETAPPPELRGRVLGAIEEEWAEPASSPSRSRSPWLARAAAIILLAGALTWGAIGSLRASRFAEEAATYDRFLSVLGGENVRVGNLTATDPSAAFEGSAVLYDSKVEQSWALILVRAPGVQGDVNVTLSGAGREIRLRPMNFGAGGEASSWLVTSANLRRFDHVRLSDAATGRTIATGTISA